MSKRSAGIRPNRIMYGLIFLAMFMSLGHHIDHIIRGNLRLPKRDTPTQETA